MQASQYLPIGEQLTFFDTTSGVLLPVSKARYRAYMARNSWFYRGDDFPCLQLIWPDMDGNFPWEPGYPEWLKPFQPDLTDRGWVRAEQAG